MALVPYLVAAGNVSPVVVSQSIPVTTAVPLGDSVICAVGTNTAVTISSLADSKGNAYTRQGYSATSPQLAMFSCAKTTAALTTSDTFTLTNSATGVAAEQWIIAAMTTAGIWGGISGPTNATSQNPVAGPLGLGASPVSWCCSACANTNGGGAPTVSGGGEPWVIMNKQQNGTNQVITLAVALLAAPSASVTWNLVSSVANDVAVTYMACPSILLAQQHLRTEFLNPGLRRGVSATYAR